MIDRATFDTQISQIRDRYMKLVGQKSTSSHQTSSQKKQYKNVSIDDHVTPLKLTQRNERKERNGQRENVHTQGRSKRSQITSRFSKNDVIFADGIMPIQKFPTPRQSLKSKQPEVSIKKADNSLSQKEQLLLKRMKQNEKLLRQSKEVREGKTDSFLDKVPFGKQNAQIKQKKVARNIVQYPQVNDRIILTERKRSVNIVQQHKKDKETCRYEEIIPYEYKLSSGISQFKKREVHKQPEKPQEKHQSIFIGSRQDQHTYRPRQSVKKAFEELINRDDQAQAAQIKNLFENTARIQLKIKSILSAR